MLADLRRNSRPASKALGCSQCKGRYFRNAEGVRQNQDPVPLKGNPYMLPRLVFTSFFLLLIGSVVSGCSATSGSNTFVEPGRTLPAQVPKAILRRPSGDLPVIYVSDTDTETVWIVPQSGKKQKAVGSITGLWDPTAVAVDSSQNVYVANTEGGGIKYPPAGIYIYAPGSSIPSRVLTGIPTPLWITVDANDNVYTDCVGDSGCPSGGPSNSVYVFAFGSSTYTSTLTDPNFSFIAAIAVDPTGDVFVDGGDGSHEIDEFPAGSAIPIVVNSSVRSPYAMAIDAQQNLVVYDNAVDMIEVYPPPYNGKKPKYKLKLKGEVQGLTLNSSDTALWYDTSFDVVQVTYPGFKKVESSAKLSHYDLGNLAASPPSPL